MHWLWGHANPLAVSHFVPEEDKIEPENRNALLIPEKKLVRAPSPSLQAKGNYS